MSEREDMLQRLRAAAWTDGNGRTTVHSFAGGFGADWDLADAVAFVEAADVAVWQDNWLNHDLAAQNAEGRVVRFAVPHPGRAS